MPNDKHHLHISKGVMLLFLSLIGWLVVGALLYGSRCLYHLLFFIK